MKQVFVAAVHDRRLLTNEKPLEAWEAKMSLIDKTDVVHQIDVEKKHCKWEFYAVDVA